jgi:hypothetical protein
VQRSAGQALVKAGVVGLDGDTVTLGLAIEKHRLLDGRPEQSLLESIVPQNPWQKEILRSGAVSVEGDLDFRGTLGVVKEAPVGFQGIRLTFELETDATEEQLDTLLRLTERYCVVYQTLRQPAAIRISRTRVEP